MKLKPLHNNVVVMAFSPEETTKSGIVLPETMNQERPQRGEVIAVGEGKFLDNGSRAPMSVKVGDQVIFKKYAPDEVKIDGEEYLVLGESEIIAILEN